MDDYNLILKSKRAHGEDGYAVFSIRIPNELKDKIDKIATESGYSRNSLIEILLEFATERCKIVDK